MGTWEERARYCPLCGEQLEDRAIAGRPRRACPVCPYVLYRNPGSGAAAVILHEDRVLLVRRSIEPYREHWGVPAGYQEYGETLEMTARRETLEETGLEIEITGLLALLYNRDDPRKECNIAFFRAHVVGGDAAALEEAHEVRWFDLRQLPDKIAFENNRRVLDTLQQDMLRPEMLRQDPRPPRRSESRSGAETAPEHDEGSKGRGEGR